MYELADTKCHRLHATASKASRSDCACRSLRWDRDSSEQREGQLQMRRQARRRQHQPDARCIVRRSLQPLLCSPSFFFFFCLVVSARRLRAGELPFFISTNGDSSSACLPLHGGLTEYALLVSFCTRFLRWDAAMQISLAAHATAIGFSNRQAEQRRWTGNVQRGRQDTSEDALNGDARTGLLPPPTADTREGRD